MSQNFSKNIIPFIKTLLEQCWAKDTGSDPDNWTHKNPAWGQCAVTALVFNDLFGGEIVWAEATLPSGEKISHYKNKLNGTEYDLTESQFPEGTDIPSGIPKPKHFSTTRDYVLSYKPTFDRYQSLKGNIQNFLDEINLQIGIRLMQSS